MSKVWRVTQQRTLWWSISMGVILAGLVTMALSWVQTGYPLRPSIDFIGGTRLQLERDCGRPGVCDQPIDLTQIRQVLAARGLGDSGIQVLGNQQAVAIRTRFLTPEARAALQTELTQTLGPLDPQATQIDSVGATFGEQTLKGGLLALLVSFAGIGVYLWFRFQADYTVFAFVALLHDVLVTMGVFAFLGLVAGVQVDSLFVVALLTIIGFSVNDTVVIYDRVREVLKDNPYLPINDVVDQAVRQTLGRSINTTLTTLLSLVAIVLFGGETLKTFALALIVGFLTGAYSSIFIASTLLAWWRGRRPVPPSVDLDAAPKSP